MHPRGNRHDLLQSSSISLMRGAIGVGDFIVQINFFGSRIMGSAMVSNGSIGRSSFAVIMMIMIVLVIFMDMSMG